MIKHKSAILRSATLLLKAFCLDFCLTRRAPYHHSPLTYPDAEDPNFSYNYGTWVTTQTWAEPQPACHWSTGLETLLLFKRCNFKLVEIKQFYFEELIICIMPLMYYFAFAVFWGILGAVNSSTCCNDDLRRSLFGRCFLLTPASFYLVSTSRKILILTN